MRSAIRKVLLSRKVRHAVNFIVRAIVKSSKNATLCTGTEKLNEISAEVHNVALIITSFSLRVVYLFDIRYYVSENAHFSPG